MTGLDGLANKQTDDEREVRLRTAVSIFPRFCACLGNFAFEVVCEKDIGEWTCLGERVWVGGEKKVHVSSDRPSCP